MKKTTKKVISFILVFCIIITAGITFNATRAIAENGSINNGAIKWSLNEDGVFTVNGTGYGPNYSNTILSNSEQYCPWRSYRSRIKTVIIEPGIQAIGDYWFYGCTKLESVELPDSLVKIGAYCFSGCSSLESIVIPENCCEYYNYVFNGCSKLKWAILPSDNSSSNYLHRIPDYTFNGCSNLENVWVGEGYTTIDNNAFNGCSSLAGIIWTGSTLSSVGSNFPSGASFAGNTELQNQCAALGKSYISVSGSSSSSLNYNYDLNTKTLSFTGSGAIDDCPWTNWRYFIYGLDLNGVTSVFDAAFNGCEYLTGELEIPESVTEIGFNAFELTGYDSVIINSPSITINDPAFDVDDSIVFYGVQGSGVYDYIEAARDSNTDWRCYCIGAHSFAGEHSKCAYCDLVNNELTVEPLGSHEYVYQYRLGNKLYYKCSECDIDDYSISARELLLNFSFIINTNGTAFNQTDYDGRFDIIRDGFVNMRDYKYIEDVCNGNPVEYDMNLTNENATPEAQALFRYIASVYGSKIISGQQESTWINNNPNYEMEYIYNTTGKYPAIRGLDFMNDDFDGVVSRAKAWAAQGGIVTICWHCSKNFDKSYNECKIKDDNGNDITANMLTDAEWEAVLTEGTSEHAAFIAGMDKAGNALLQLQEEGIPVLWRPFHEFDGGWFWWGGGGSDKFTRLWKMMYNHFTYDLGLNNLIWVLGYSHNGTDYGTDLADWYPGSRYCDIAGADSYEVAANGAEGRLYNPVLKTTYGAKPLTMHETGLIPTVDQLEDVPWAYFMTWHTTYLTEVNTTSALNEIYNSEYVITLDELPHLY